MTRDTTLIIPLIGVHDSSRNNNHSPFPASLPNFSCSTFHFTNSTRCAILFYLHDTRFGITGYNSILLGTRLSHRYAPEPELLTWMTADYHLVNWVYVGPRWSHYDCGEEDFVQKGRYRLYGCMTACCRSVRNWYVRYRRRILGNVFDAIHVYLIGRRMIESTTRDLQPHLGLYDSPEFPDELYTPLQVNPRSRLLYWPRRQMENVGGWDNELPLYRPKPL